MTAGAVIHGRQRRSHPRLRVLFAVVVLWVAFGLLRAPAVARDYFTRAAGDGATVANLHVGVGLPVPPFWYLSLDGEVSEAGSTGPGYHGAMLLLVEPITGWVLVMGAG